MSMDFSQLIQKIQYEAETMVSFECQGIFENDARMIIGFVFVITGVRIKVDATDFQLIAVKENVKYPAQYRAGLTIKNFGA